MLPTREIFKVSPGDLQAMEEESSPAPGQSPGVGSSDAPPAPKDIEADMGVSGDTGNKGIRGA